MALAVTPNSGQTLNQTLTPIQSNFGTINTAFLVNHVEYGTTGQGKHNLVTMPVQGSDPGTLANEMALYTKTDSATSSSVPQMYIQNASSGAVVNFTASLQATNGWTRLPSGILLVWATTAVPRNTLTLVSFPTGPLIPVFSNVFMVVASQTFSAGPSTGDLNTAPCVGNFTTTNFQVYPRANGLPSSGSVSICYYAIGN